MPLSEVLEVTASEKKPYAFKLVPKGGGPNMTRDQDLGHEGGSGYGTKPGF